MQKVLWLLIVYLSAGCGLLNPVAMIEDLPDVTMLNTPEGVLQYILDHPDQVSLAALDPYEKENAIYHNAQVSRPLASTIKVLVAAEYARQIEQGLINPNELISTDSVLLYHIPLTDGGAHRRAAKYFKGRSGVVNKISLDHVAQSMIWFSDNAATDYLIHRLGRSAIENGPRSWGLLLSDAPAPLNGHFLTWTTIGKKSTANNAYSLSKRFAHKRFYRRWKKWTTSVVAGLGLGYYGQRIKSRFLPSGTAEEYTELLSKIYADSLISHAASQRVFNLLSRQKDEVQPIEGGKGGSVAGVLTRTSFYVEVSGSTSRARIVTLMFEGLPFPVWRKLSQGSFSRFIRKMQEDEIFYMHVKESIQRFNLNR